MKFKVYPISLLANQSEVIFAVGRYCRVLTATGNVSITVGDIGPFGPLAAGQGFRLPVEQPEFLRIVVTDLTGSNNNGTLIVADADFVDQTLVGNVSIIDGGKARTLASQAFMGVVYQGAVAAAMSHCQLWNPPANTKSLVVESITTTTTGASGTFGVGSKNAALSTAANAPAPKLVGGSGSSASSFTQTNAVALITAGTQLDGFNGTTNQTIMRKYAEPIVVPPGQGLIVWNNTLNADLTSIFEYFEQSVT